MIRCHIKIQLMTSIFILFGLTYLYTTKRTCLQHTAINLQTSAHKDQTKQKQIVFLTSTFLCFWLQILEFYVIRVHMYVHLYVHR